MPHCASSPAAGTTPRKEWGPGTEGGVKGFNLPGSPPSATPAQATGISESEAWRMLGWPPPSPAQPSHTGAICLSIPHPWDATAALSGARPYGTGAWALAEATAAAGWPTEPAPHAPSPLGYGVCFPKHFLTQRPHIHNPAEQELNGRTPITVHHGLDLPSAGRFPMGAKGSRGRSCRGGVEGASEHGTSCHPQCCSRLCKHRNGARESKVSKVFREPSPAPASHRGSVQQQKWHQGPEGV